MYRTWQGGAEIAAIVIFVSILAMDHFEAGQAGCIWSVSTLNGLGVDLWWLAHWPQNTEYWPMWHITVLQAHVHSNSHHLPMTPLNPSVIATLYTAFIYLSDIHIIIGIVVDYKEGRILMLSFKKVLTNFSGFPRCADWQRRRAGAELWAALTLWQ